MFSKGDKVILIANHNRFSSLGDMVRSGHFKIGHVYTICGPPKELCRRRAYIAFEERSNISEQSFWIKNRNGKKVCIRQGNIQKYKAPLGGPSWL